MGKCLSRTEKLGKGANDLKHELRTLKDFTEPSPRTQLFATATNQMGVSGSTSRHHSATTSPGSAAGRLHGAGEQSDKLALDKTGRHLGHQSSTPSAAPALGDRASNEQAVHDRCAGNFFNRYRDPENDVILADGIERLCTDIGVAPDDFRVLVLAWKFKAEAMCRFTREEFIGGCRALGGVDSPQAIGDRLPDLVAEVVDSREQFRDLYRWTYRFGLDEGQRTLPLAMAMSLWQLVFSQRPPAVLERWLAFLERRPSGSSGIMRDTWDMFLPFTEVIGTDFERYDESEAWPSLIDDFVEYENDRKNHNVAASISGVDFCHK